MTTIDPAQPATRSRGHIEEMVTLVKRCSDTPCASFKGRLMSIVKTFCPLIKQYIFHEDHVLYPVAVVMIDDADF